MKKSKKQGELVAESHLWDSHLFLIILLIIATVQMFVIEGNRSEINRFKSKAEKEVYNACVLEINNENS